MIVPFPLLASASGNNAKERLLLFILCVLTQSHARIYFAFFLKNGVQRTFNVPTIHVHVNIGMQMCVPSFIGNMIVYGIHSTCSL